LQAIKFLLDLQVNLTPYRQAHKMVATQFAKLIGLKNPWPRVETLTSIMESEWIHERNKENIATLVLVLSSFTTAVISYSLSMAVTYRVSFIPLFLSITVLACIPFFKSIVRFESIAVILSAVTTFILGITFGPLIDFSISPIPVLAVMILVVSTHIWYYLLKDLDKNLYPITQADINHIRMNKMMQEMHGVFNKNK